MDYYISVLKNYAVFSGRARRKEFWMFILFNFIISVILSVIGNIIHFQLIGYIYSALMIIPGFSVGARRLHDTNKTGWWQLISIIPFIGIIILIVFWATDSTPGDNMYGASPKGM